MDERADTPRHHAKTAPSHPAPAMWRTKRQVCSDLSISSRTLNRRVQAGTIERRQTGKTALYRPRHAMSPAPVRHHATPPAPQSATLAPISGSHAMSPAPQSTPKPQPELSHLVNLTEQLTDDLIRAKEERGEAVGIGWMLSEQNDKLTQERDQLAARLAWLQRQVMRVSDSALSLPVRRHLRSVLNKSIH
jgi:hypothetical protein